MGIHFTWSPKIKTTPTKRGKDTYYGYIEEIWELDYGRGLKVQLFQRKWVNLTRGGVMEDPHYGITTVDLNNLAYADEPFVLANDVAQVFYVKDMSTKPRKRKDKEANARLLRSTVVIPYCGSSFTPPRVILTHLHRNKETFKPRPYSSYHMSCI